MARIADIVERLSFVGLSGGLVVIAVWIAAHHRSDPQVGGATAVAAPAPSEQCDWLTLPAATEKAEIDVFVIVPDEDEKALYLDLQSRETAFRVYTREPQRMLHVFIASTATEAETIRASISDQEKITAGLGLPPPVVVDLIGY